MRVGIAGCGNMGRNHLRAWSELTDVDVVGIADPEPAALQAAARIRQVRCYCTVAELLERERPDVLTIATPTRTHEEAIALAVERGVHVLVEKPLAQDVATAERIADRVAAAGVMAMVGYIERFNPALREMRRRLELGQLGSLYQLTSRRVGPFPPRIRDVGVVHDLATHDLDQVRYLLRAELELLFAQAARRVHERYEDLVTVVGRSTSGTVVSLEVNWLTPQKTRETVVLGEGGMLVANSLTQDLYLYENNYEEGAWRLLSTLRGVSEGNMVRFALHREEPLRAELMAFAKAVREHGPSPVPLDDGIQALRLAEATIESARSGTPVTFA